MNRWEACWPAGQIMDRNTAIMAMVLVGHADPAVLALSSGHRGPGRRSPPAARVSTRMTHLAKDRGDPHWLHRAVMVPVSPRFFTVAIHPYWSPTASGCRLAIRALAVKFKQVTAVVLLVTGVPCGIYPQHEAYS
jgi:hypothetical protein